jgi:RNA polymerase sigma factor (sigma-70 family)
VYISASFYPKYKFPLIAEHSSQDTYKQGPRSGLGEDEIADVRRALQRISRNRIPNPSDAEDLVQETLLTMISREPAEELKKGLLVWCQGILRNKVGNYYRKARRHVSLKEGSPGRRQMQLFPLDGPTPEITAWHMEMRSIIEEKIRELSPDTRRVMELMVSGLNAGEIARLLSPEPYQNVMNRLYRGRKKLARELIKCGFGPKKGKAGNRGKHGESVARITPEAS